MGKYNSAIITTEGINMFTSAIGGGDTVTFMTMQASSHAYPSTTDFMSLTSLQDVEATVNVNYAGVYNTNVVQVSARFDNDGVSTAYLINTLGLFAKLGNGEPKLVAVVTAVTPDQMPVYDANNPSAFIYNLQCTVQNAGSMAVSVNPAGTVTVEQFNEEMATKLGRTDNAVSATKLQTSRSLTVDLGSTTSASFDGSADASIGVSGELPIANGGTGASTKSGARSALGVPPTNHAVANTTYGSGTSTNYGHVKLSDTYDTVEANAKAANGVGASQNALANAYRNLQPQIDSLEPRVSSSEQALTVNLLNPTLTSRTVNGITVTKNADNTYTLNGTATQDTYLVPKTFTATKSQNFRITGCPRGGSENTFFVFINKSSGGTDAAPDFGYGTTKQLLAGESYNFFIAAKSGTVCDNLVFKPMITTNLSATYADYIPYSGSSGKLDTDYKTLHDAIDTKAPTNHAVANTTYGSGTATNYGHVKLSDDYSNIDANADAAHGVGASALALQKSSHRLVLGTESIGVDIPTRFRVFNSSAGSGGKGFGVQTINSDFTQLLTADQDGVLVYYLLVNGVRTVQHAISLPLIPFSRVPNSNDLNAITNVSMGYIINATNQPNGVTNYGLVLTISTESDVSNIAMQFYAPLNTNSLWFRTKFGGNWFTWRQL